METWPWLVTVAALFVTAGPAGADPASKLGSKLDSGLPGATEWSGTTAAPLRPSPGSMAWAPDLAKTREVLTGVNSTTADTRRGTKEVALYARAAPSVVLIVNGDQLGSGVVVDKKGGVVTNWHVVNGASEVGVIFKPELEGQKIRATDLRRALVVRIDENTDLALLKVQVTEARIKPLQFGALSNVAVGSDVHAIGHPTGESWTYTRGVISQIRRAYDWTDADGVLHQADVIQTQTPINPGNSGGPLLDDDGKLVGVNSFKAVETEGLNFAVAVDEVRRLLSAKSDRYASRSERRSSSGADVSCEAQALRTRRTEKPAAQEVFVDLNCDGEPEALITKPDLSSEAIVVALDLDKDGVIEGVLIDKDRDGRIEFSIWDSDGDGEPDLVGRHPDGGWRPGSYEVMTPER